MAHGQAQAHANQCTKVVSYLVMWREDPWGLQIVGDLERCDLTCTCRSSERAAVVVVVAVVAVVAHQQV